MKNIFIIFLFFGLTNIVSASPNPPCSLSGPTTVAVPSSGITVPYTILGGFNTMCYGNVTASWDGPNLGTVSSLSCTGFSIAFVPQNATSTLNISYTAEPLPNEFTTVNCSITITTTCFSANPPVFQTEASQCGIENYIKVIVTTGNPINNYQFSNLNNLTLISSGVDGGENVEAEFELIDPCSTGSLFFSYSNDCGTNSGSTSISLAYDRTIGEITGPTDVCIEFGSQLITYRIDVEDYEEDCISVNWDVSNFSASIHSMGEDGTSPYIRLFFLEHGLYQISATVEACGQELTDKTKTLDVLVCKVPDNPPLELQYLCPYSTISYNLSSECYSDLTITPNEPGLSVTVNGTLIEITDILGTPRTATLNVVQAGGCFASVTWTIFIIDNPKECKGRWLQNPPNSSNVFMFDNTPVQFELPTLAPESDMEVTVIDLNGRILLEGNYDLFQRSFDLKTETTGILIARIIVDGVSYTEKFFTN
ncbi:MAG: hypothetical protein AB8H03_07180 [Saprospiraceae bacterium]